MYEQAGGRLVVGIRYGCVVLRWVADDGVRALVALSAEEAQTLVKGLIGSLKLVKEGAADGEEDYGKLMRLKNGAKLTGAS